MTLSRLVARGLVESPDRGRYRLAPSTDPLNDFVERWRLGEARLRPWREGAWLLAHCGALGDGSRWALHALGLRELRAGLWARPDNLALALPELRAPAESIGLHSAVLLFEAAPENEPMPRSWLRAWLR